MKNTWNDFVKPIVVLGVLCLVTSLLLAVTNNVTAPIIAENAHGHGGLCPSVPDGLQVRPGGGRGEQMILAANFAAVLSKQSKTVIIFSPRLL